jgi:hypothetical protein
MQVNLDCMHNIAMHEMAANVILNFNSMSPAAVFLDIGNTFDEVKLSP